MSVAKDSIERKYTGLYINITDGYEVQLESKPGTFVTKGKEPVIFYKKNSYEQYTEQVFKGVFTKDGRFLGTWYSDMEEAFPFALSLNNTYRAAYNTSDGYTYLQISGLNDLNIQQKINQRLKGFKRGYHEEIKDDRKYENTFDFEVIYFGDNTLTILEKRKQVSSYYDEEEDEEAYGFTPTVEKYRKYWTLNLKTGNLVTYSDLFTDSSRKKLGQIIKSELYPYHEDMLIATIESVYVTDAGVSFPIFLDYDVQGKSYEMPFTLTYGEIDEFIKPDGLLRE